MAFYLSIILLFKANGWVIPNSVWWLFGLYIVCTALKYIIDEREKKNGKQG